MQQQQWFDARRLRGILAEEQITYTRLAAACDLNREYLCHVLAGKRKPGELMLIKLERGLRTLGLSLDTTGGSHDAA